MRTPCRTSSLAGDRRAGIGSQIASGYGVTSTGVVSALLAKASIANSASRHLCTADLFRGLTVWLLCGLVAALPLSNATVVSAQCTTGTGVPCVGFDSSSSHQVGGDGSNPSSITFSHTVNPAGLKKALVVAVSIRKIASETTLDPPTVTSVTYNSNALVIEQQRNNTEGLGVASEARCELWIQVSPSSGTNNVVVTLSRGAESIIAGAVTATNVDQADPVRSSTNARNAGSATATETITSVGGDLVVDVLAIKGDSSITSVGAGQTARWNRSTGAAITNLKGGGSTEPGSFPIVTMDWNLGSVTPWVVCSLTLQPDAVTAVGFEMGRAVKTSRGILLKWRTGYEASNLGFNIYREDIPGQQVKVTHDLIAGSSLFTKGSLASGYSYAWLDPNGKESSRYWIEDVDLAGTERLNGPYAVVDGVDQIGSNAKSGLLAEVNSNAAASSVLPFPVSAPNLVTGVTGHADAKGTGGGPAVQFALASQPALKISVDHQGWYRVSYADVVNAGIDPSRINPRNLRLYLYGQEQAIAVNGELDGSFDASDSIEFFGTGIDTAWTGTNVYWLAMGTQPGKRVRVSSPGAGQPASSSFPFTVQLKERLVYFAALNNGESENFFGKVVAATPADHHLAITNVEATSNISARLEVALQGVTVSAHNVLVTLNGTLVGNIAFSDQARKIATISVPHSLIHDGDNVVALAGIGGSTDVSIVDYVRITYQHVSSADGNELALSTGVREGFRRIGGFTSNQVRVVDVTTADAVQELSSRVARNTDGTYVAEVQLPGLTSRKLLAFTADRIKSPSAIEINRPSSWNLRAHSVDFVMIAHADFVPALAPLVALRQSQGYRVSVVDINDVYDEFSFGVHTPLAINQFLSLAKLQWAVGPRFVVLVGDASLDPRDYFGAGSFDFVPTRSVSTDRFEAISDDALADANGDFISDVAIGRLPVRTALEASVVVNKIVSYDQGPPPLRRALLVADVNDGSNFEFASQQVRALLPSDMEVDEVFRQQLGDPATRNSVLGHLDAGPGIVNYSGHGSIDIWRGDVLTSSDFQSLTNAGSLSVFVIGNCLNAYFHDPSVESLAEAALKAPSGGAVAVWASSGITSPIRQQRMFEEFYSLLFQGQSLTIGEAAMRAKLVVNDDVRKTWVLLGDPATRYR